MNAKSIFYILAWMAGLILVSYSSVQAYTYFTTTTLSDVQKSYKEFLKAKSEMEKNRVEYCNDSATWKVDYDSCWEFLNKKLYEDTTKTQAEGNENDTSSWKQVSGDRNTWSVEITWTSTPDNKVDEAKLEECLSKYTKIDNTIANVCMDYAKWTRTSNLDFEIVTERLSQLHEKVCQKQINSPLCKDEALFDRLYQITEERLPWKNFYPILLGITNAESSLGLNFAKDKVWGTCAGRNNWGGIKWKKTDDGKSVKDQQIPDQFWCYLYKFDSIEDYWISKVNTIRFWYPWCVDSKTPVRCLSGKYVWDPNVQEESWINNVSVFLN